MAPAAAREEHLLALEELRQRDQLWRARLQEALSSLDGSQVEQVMLEANTKEYFERSRERDQVNQEIIGELRTQLEAKRRHVERLQARLEQSETQCARYYQALRELQADRDQWQAANRKREDPQVSGYASSLLNGGGPPVSLQEMLGMTAPGNLAELTSSARSCISNRSLRYRK